MKRVIATGLSLATIGGALYFFTRPDIDYGADNPGPEVTIAIAEGEPGSRIADTLFSNGVVRTRQAFLNVIYADDRSRRIQPGGHRIQTRIPAKVALEQLLDPQRRVGVMTFPEGLRTAEVLRRLQAEGVDIKNALTQVQLPLGAKKIEGFLFPGQYAFKPDVSGSEAIAAMVNRFGRQTVNLERDSKALGLSAYEGLIVASLLQAEGVPSDYSKILRVILNRREIGMALQIDATVLYALNESGRIRVTNRDLAVNSPYNTYKYRGLPPTPINNPGREAIDALATPAEGNWLYYITVKPGDTRFTRSHDQFVEWKAEFRRNYRAGLFK